MAKILLVEDDDNLRGIYGDRLSAEGYEIVAARDGEEALALAVNEKPDLIISDIMMPKISGFDMLDILRSTKETKHTKVIMMTALSQKEDQERGKSLGADRYLVKSQVTLEDVVRVAAEVLAEGQPTAAGQTPAAEQTPTTTQAAAQTGTPTAPEPPTPAPATDDKAATSQAATVANEKDEVEKQIEDFSKQVDNSASSGSGSTIESASVGGDRVVQPLHEDVGKKPDINELLEKEMSVPGKAQPPADTPPPKPEAEKPDGAAPHDIAL